MSVFRFRRFTVENTESAMKVNTDGVLLGALMTIRSEDRTYLDVGTGTGTIALMAAQRVSVFSGTSDVSADGVSGKISPDAPAIIGIDIDEASAREAGQNFAASPWPDMLEAKHLPLSGLSGPDVPAAFDHIFSNPPYYDLSLQAPDMRRNAARHTDTLSYRELAAFAAEHLASDGILSMILPADSELWLLRHARMNGLQPVRIVRIRTVERKKPSRIVAEFSKRHSGDCLEQLLTLMKDGSFTPEYRELTKPFYINI